MCKNSKHLIEVTEILRRLKVIQRNLRRLKRKPLTVEKAAAYMGLSVSHLHKLTSAKAIPHYKPNGKTIYFTKRDLDRYIFSNRKNSKKEIDRRAISISLKMSNQK
jgi:excisionase family DNA binding protein